MADTTNKDATSNKPRSGDKPVLPKDHQDDMVARGDHTSKDLEGSYRDNPDKPAPESVAQLQDVPEGWPTGHPAEDKASSTK